MSIPRRSVRMDDDEMWDFLTAGHTGILTSLRRDGWPVALPVWFAVVEREIFVTTRGRKVQRLERDPRCSFLVEAGLRWSELRAVHLSCRAEVLDDVDPDLGSSLAEEFDRKYAASRTRTAEMPTATRNHYRVAQGSTVRLVPEGKRLTWDNRHLGLK